MIHAAVGDMMNRNSISFINYIMEKNRDFQRKRG